MNAIVSDKKHITTKSGFECDIGRSVFDDFELLDLAVEVDNGNAIAAITILNKIIAPEDKKRLYDHLRTSDGRVPVESIAEEIQDIFAGLDESKKSQSSPE